MESGVQHLDGHWFPPRKLVIVFFFAVPTEWCSLSGFDILQVDPTWALEKKLSKPKMQEPDKHRTHIHMFGFSNSVLEHSARLRTGANREAQFRAEAAGRNIEIFHVAFVVSMVQWDERVRRSLKKTPSRDIHVKCEWQLGCACLPFTKFTAVFSQRSV